MKITTRIGKIARLPKAIREELNRRLDDGASGKALVRWLNELPEVQDLVKNEFGGHGIREPNLSHWKHGGYRDWVLRQEALDYARSVTEDAEALETGKNQRRLTENLELWVGSRYAVATREIAETKGKEGWQMLRQMCADLVQLRRLDQHDERLELERERMELNRARLELEHQRFEADSGTEEVDGKGRAHPWSEWTEEERMAWAKQPENREILINHPEAPHDSKRHLDRIFERDDDDGPIHAALRERVEALEAEGRREWTGEERIAWARLPENYDRVIIQNTFLSEEDEERRFRRILGQQTEEDKAYWAQVEADEADDE